MNFKAIVLLCAFGGLTAVFAAQPVLSDGASDAGVRLASKGEAMSERLARRAGQSRVEWPRENPPRPLPARPVTFPPYELR